jgi:hypothetical protein
MDAGEGQALLWTPNGSGVAWLLTQHGIPIGLKVVTRVNLFYPEIEPVELDYWRPSLLFWIEDLEAEEKKEGKTDNESEGEMISLRKSGEVMKAR